MVKSGFKVKIDNKKIIKELTKQTKSNLMKQTYEIDCPQCKQNIKAVPGMTTCPKCKFLFNFDLRIDLD